MHASVSQSHVIPGVAKNLFFVILSGAKNLFPESDPSPAAQDDNEK